MSLHYVIDGYNMIRHKAYSPSSKLKDERQNLLHFISSDRLCGSAKNKVTVVFDGYPRQENIEAENIEVVFSGEKTADEKIKKLIESCHNPKIVIVVSDDREIKDFAKLHSVKAVGIEEFFIPKSKSLRMSARESLKPELSYSQIHKINQELKNIWLK